MSRNSVLLTIVGALAVLVLAWLFLISPQNTELAEVQAQTEAQEAQAGQLRAQIGTLEAVRASAPEIEAQIAEIEAIVPTDPGLSTLYRQLQAAADDAGVTLTAVTPTRPVAADDPANPALYVMSLSLTLQGSYFQTVDFLRRVEDPGITARGIEVAAVSISTGEYPLLEVAVTGSMYAVLDDPPLPASAVPPAPTEQPTDAASEEDDT